MTDNRTPPFGYGTPEKHELQFLRGLQERGIRSDDVLYVQDNAAVMNAIAEIILRHRLFIAPKHQPEMILTFNERLWKDVTITERSIRDLGDPPAHPLSDLRQLRCTTLVADTGNAVETFLRNWQAFQSVYPGARVIDEILLDLSSIRSRNGAVQRPKGLRWIEVELGRALRHHALQEAQEKLTHMHMMHMGQELPLITAIHTRWVTAMDGGLLFPWVDAPDIEVAYYDVTSCDGAISRTPSGKWHAPYILHNNGYIELRVGRREGGTHSFGSIRNIA